MIQFLFASGALLLGVAIAVVNLLLSSWGLITLWRWFLTPAYDLAPPSYRTAMGVLLLLGVAIHRQPYGKDDHSTSEKIGASLAALLVPIIGVALGWVISLLF